MNNRLVNNFTPGGTFFHRLNGATKVMLFIVVTVYIIMAFDVRVLLPMFIANTIVIVSMKPNWKPIALMFGFLFLVTGLWGSFLLFFVAPEAGLRYVGQETEMIRFNGYLYLTNEFLWYASMAFFKRVASFASVIMFILSITPSELAAGLNKIKLPYKVCMVISLGFRTIPGVARDYIDISNSMQMRGMEMSAKKASLFKRVRQSALMIVPLAISSFAKVETMANAMDLRGFGKMRTRTWYSEHTPTRTDMIVRAATAALLMFVIFYIAYFRILNPWPFRYWYPYAAFTTPW